MEDEMEISAVGYGALAGAAAFGIVDQRAGFVGLCAWCVFAALGIFS